MARPRCVAKRAETARRPGESRTPVVAAAESAVRCLAGEMQYRRGVPGTTLDGTPRVRVEDNSRTHTYAQPPTLRNRWKVIWTKAPSRGGDNCCILRGGTHPLRLTRGEVALHQGWRPLSMSPCQLWLRKRAQETSEDAANSR